MFIQRFLVHIKKKSKSYTKSSQYLLQRKNRQLNLINNFHLYVSLGRQPNFIAGLAEILHIKTQLFYSFASVLLKGYSQGIFYL